MHVQSTCKTVGDSVVSWTAAAPTSFVHSSASSQSRARAVVTGTVITKLSKANMRTNDTIAFSVSMHNSVSKNENDMLKFTVSIEGGGPSALWRVNLNPHTFRAHSATTRTGSGRRRKCGTLERHSSTSIPIKARHDLVARFREVCRAN
jgi:hypothetical protein